MKSLEKMENSNINPDLI